MTGSDCRREDTSLSQAIVAAVSEEAGREPTELTPLYRFVDPDALDRLFTTGSREEPRTDGEVVLSYEGYEVTVDSYGRIELEEASWVTRA